MLWEMQCKAYISWFRLACLVSQNQSVQSN